MFRIKLIADVKKNKITYELTYEGLMFHVEHYWKKIKINNNIIYDLHNWIVHTHNVWEIITIIKVIYKTKSI